MADVAAIRWPLTETASAPASNSPLTSSAQVAVLDLLVVVGGVGLGDDDPHALAASPAMNPVRTWSRRWSVATARVVVGESG